MTYLLVRADWNTVSGDAADPAVMQMTKNAMHQHLLSEQHAFTEAGASKSINYHYY